MTRLQESARLKFRLLNESDKANVLSTAADPAVMRYISGGAKSETDALGEMDRWLKLDNGEHGLFVAEQKYTGEFVGFFILRELENTGLTEVGFRLPKHQWGKGYASEGLRSLLHYAIHFLKKSVVVAVVKEGNVASTSVLEKSGFVSKGIKRHYGADLLLYELSAHAFSSL